jgi:aldehyde dehydrogenase (NAD+)
MVWNENPGRLFIGGSWAAPSSTEQAELISPFTEEIVARAPLGTRQDIDQAVAAARRAFDHGPWPRTRLADRIAVLARVHESLIDSREVIADLLTEEMGCPITQSRTIQADVARTILQSYLDLAVDFPFSSVRRSANATALVTREPVGVVAAIVPWNVPQAIITHKLAPALLTGCTVVLKPAPETALDAFLLAELFRAAGLPEGVLSVVPADRDVSEHLVTHPGVDKVTFTGSTAAGRRIASLCGNDLRRVTLELGGKSAAVILEDADLETTVESLRMGSLRNSGQVCSLKTRLVVPRSRERELLDRLAGLIESMPVGDPSDPATQIGPMATAGQRNRVEEYIAIGKQEGARAVIGGGRPDGHDRGYFVEPTVFAGVEPGMRIAQEEIFGPVLTVLTYEGEDQAVDIANDSRYGLSGAVFTTDPDRGLAVARRMRTGTVELNGNPTGWHAPYGGFKDSGIGREAGIEGFESYVETKSIGLTADLAGQYS